ncbi:MAG: FHA domain-containing protein, partial [Acidimicrobiales bacterium]
MPGASGARNTTRQTASTGTLMLVVLGDDAVPAFPLHAPNLLVGRSPDNDIVLGETSVSARHARIDLRGGQVFLTDLGSTNGTFVAGRRVTGSVELQPGDTVALGRCLVRLEGSPAVAARPIHQPERAPDPVVDPVPVAVPGPQPVGAPESLLGAAWLAALQRAVEAPQVPARRPLRLLI